MPPEISLASADRLRNDIAAVRVSQTTIYRKRCKRWDLPSEAHYLTFSCFHGQPFLGRDRSRGWLVEAVVSAATEHSFDVWAWVLMPEHVHLLVYPRQKEYKISGFLKSIKQPVGQKAMGWVWHHAPAFAEHMEDAQPNGRVAHRFWQRGGGFDRNLCSSEEVWEKVQYIHENPVRRGLITRAIDWPWSSARACAGLEKGPIPLNHEFFPRR